MKLTNNDDSKFQELLTKRRKLSNEKKTNVKKIFANDSQLSDTINNFNESNQYQKQINYK